VQLRLADGEQNGASWNLGDGSFGGCCLYAHYPCRDRSGNLRFPK
jgi:hypothetical protein